MFATLDDLSIWKKVGIFCDDKERSSAEDKNTRSNKTDLTERAPQAGQRMKFMSGMVYIRTHHRLVHWFEPVSHKLSVEVDAQLHNFDSQVHNNRPVSGYCELCLDNCPASHLFALTPRACSTFSTLLDLEAYMPVRSWCSGLSLIKIQHLPVMVGPFGYVVTPRHTTWSGNVTPTEEKIIQELQFSAIP